MKKTFIIVLLFTSILVFGQVSDDFTDGDFTANPVWTGNTNSFVIRKEALHSAGPNVANTTLYLQTNNIHLNDTEWSFLIDLDFNPTASTFVRVYLASTQSNLSGALNGYYIQIGQSTADYIKFFRQDGLNTTELFTGSTSLGTGNILVRVKVTRSNRGEWRIFTDTKGGFDFSSEGSAVTDNRYTATSSFGVYCSYATASRYNLYHFDDFYVGNIITDNKAPALETVQVPDQTTISVLFDEKITAISAQNVKNYSANNGIGTPASAVLQPDGKIVYLTFSKPLPEGSSELTVAGIEDLAGNAMQATTQSFIYFVSHPAEFNDIVINEFFPDPTPQIGLPTIEFVEVYNRSNKSFDLAGWKLSDGSSTATLPSAKLHAGEYLILTNSSGATAYSSFGKVLGLSNFPTLNNSGDAIKLTDAANVQIDSVNYTINWYQDDDKSEGGYTLERLNPSANSNEITNWQASENNAGGTPGNANSILGKNPDSKAPLLQNLIVASDKELLLEFSESLSVAEAQNILNYTVSNTEHPLTASVQADSKNVQLTFSRTFSNGIEYSISIRGIKDLADNTITDTEKTFVYFVPVSSTSKDVLFTEIMADPSPVVLLPEAEFVEIYNRSPNAIDLKGWKLSDATTTATLPSSILLPDAFLVLTSTANAPKFSTYTKALGVSGFPSLNNDGEVLVLKNADGELIDSLNYNPQWYKSDEKQDGGWSLELIDPVNTCGEEDNWIAADNEQGGTPGRVNSVLANKPDITGPRLLHVVPVNSREIIVQFDEKLQNTVAATSFLISPKATVAKAAFTDLSLRQIELTLEEDLSPRQLYDLHLVDIYDCNGNIVREEYSRALFALPEVADSLDLVINELLFNPRTGGVDFVEVYNHSPKYINLKGLKLANFENEIENERLITSEDILIGPNDYMVFAEDPSVLKNHLPQTDLGKTLRMDLPSLPDDEGSLVIADASSKVLDYLSYSSKFHSPLIKDEEGISLERISFTSATNASENWKSANASAGYATPGYRNSNARESGSSVGNGIEIVPEIFSAGGITGDFVQVKYKFEESGQVANVKIFDQQGHAIKELSNNQTIGYDGSFRWDGDRDDGSKARNGYYFVWVEVFNTNGTVRTFRRRVVVASR